MKKLLNEFLMTAAVRTHTHTHTLWREPFSDFSKLFKFRLLCECMNLCLYLIVQLDSDNKGILFEH